MIAVTTASQAESLAFGVRALDPLTSVVVITPVDMKPVREATLRQLLGALTAGVDAVSPTCGGVGGHPVVIRRAALEAYAAVGPSASLHALLKSLGSGAHGSRSMTLGYRET